MKITSNCTECGAELGEVHALWCEHSQGAIFCVDANECAPESVTEWRQLRQSLWVAQKKVKGAMKRWPRSEYDCIFRLTDAEQALQDLMQRCEDKANALKKLTARKIAATQKTRKAVRIPAAR